MTNRKFINASLAAIEKTDAERHHWAISGQSFASVSGVYAIAKLKGATISFQVCRARLIQGAATWDELLAPPKTKNNQAKAKTTRQRQRDEMAELMAAIDQRKRDMGIES
jgi:hypothetical protein